MVILLLVDFTPYSIHAVSQNSTTRISVSDNITAPEGVSNDLVIKNAVLTQKINDLTDQVQGEKAENTIIGLAGIVATGIAGFVGYLISKRDLKNTIKQIVVHMADVANSQLRIRGEDGQGEVEVNSKGKAVAKHKRSIHESVGNITDSIGVKVRRWHDDPNGPEVLKDGRRGFYTDEE